MRRFVRIALLAPALLAAQERRFALDDMAKLVRLSSPQISPDGRSIVFVAERPNVDANRWDAQLILLDIGSGAQRVLVSGREVSSPQWAPAGNAVAFLTIADGVQQVFTVRVAGGEPRAMTAVRGGVRLFAWRPDGGTVSYITRDTVSGPVERFNNAFEIGNDPYTIGAAPVSSHIWIGDHRLTSGTWSAATGLSTSPLSWSPDGSSIAFVRFASPHSGDTDQSAVWVLNTRTGASQALTGRTAREGNPVFSPHGNAIAYSYPRDGDPANLDEVRVDPLPSDQRRPPKILTGALDRHVTEFAWLPAGDGLLLLGTDGTRSALWFQPLDGRARPVALGQIAGVSEINVGPTGAIVFVGAEPARPSEIYYLTSFQGAPRRVTDFHAEIAARTLGSSEHVEWDTDVGLKADGVLTVPPGFLPGTRYPLVLLIHGGPTASSTEEFYARAQLLAAQGWLVFQPNYRGSDNRGNAFQRAIASSAAEGPARDIMAGVAALVRRGIVDTTRIAVSGWSYGGYLTAWLLGRYPEQWRAAVAGAAPVSLFDMYNLSDLNVMRRHAITASPWVGDRVAAWLAESPLTHLWKIRAPTLIMSSTGDARVAVTGSYTLYRALKDNNVPVQFIGYPGPGHSPGDPVRQRDVNRRWIDWLALHLR